MAEPMTPARLAEIKAMSMAWWWLERQRNPLGFRCKCSECIDCLGDKMAYALPKLITEMERLNAENARLRTRLERALDYEASR